MDAPAVILSLRDLLHLAALFGGGTLLLALAACTKCWRVAMARGRYAGLLRARQNVREQRDLSYREGMHDGWSAAGSLHHAPLGTPGRN